MVDRPLPHTLTVPLTHTAPRPFKPFPLSPILSCDPALKRLPPDLDLGSMLVGWVYLTVMPVLRDVHLSNVARMTDWKHLEAQTSNWCNIPTFSFKPTEPTNITAC